LLSLTTQSEVKGIQEDAVRLLALSMLWVWLRFTGLAADVALFEPPLLDAVTITRMVWPVSAEPTVYVLAVAPEILAQASPLVLQRSHW
jgi:hypothetical protein